MTAAVYFLVGYRRPTVIIFLLLLTIISQMRRPEIFPSSPALSPLFFFIPFFLYVITPNPPPERIPNEIYIIKAN